MKNNKNRNGQIQHKLKKLGKTQIVLNLILVVILFFVVKLLIDTIAG